MRSAYSTAWSMPASLSSAPMLRITTKRLQPPVTSSVAGESCVWSGASPNERFSQPQEYETDGVAEGLEMTILLNKTSNRSQSRIAAARALHSIHNMGNRNSARSLRNNTSQDRKRSGRSSIHLGSLLTQWSPPNAHHGLQFDQSDTD